MPILSWTELQRLTRSQLFSLMAVLMEVIANTATSSEDRDIATALLHNVRLALFRKHPSP